LQQVIKKKPVCCATTLIILNLTRSVVILPDAGPENPFQYELASFLRKKKFKVNIGKKYTLGSTFRAVRAHRPDVLYFDWVHSFILGQSAIWTYFKSLVFVLEIIFVKYFKHIPITHTLHNLQNHAGLYLKLERIVYGFFLKNCTHIRVYSETTKAAAIEKFGLDSVKIAVIQDLPFHYYYQNNITQSEARAELQLAGNQFVYLFFGEIKPYKGLHDLIPVFKTFAQPTDRLVIAGKSYDVDYFESLKKLADNSEHVIWYHRFIEDDEVQTFFNAANVVVLPFVRIDHSGSVDLAMSFRKPVVTLKTESMCKLLANQTELLFETPSELAGCLQQVKTIDSQAIGQQNYLTADSTNYQDILRLFA
jgi:beta-1,4-mannosyltransferase